jgi:hypothetical protein
MSELKNTPEICKAGATGLDLWLIGSAPTSGKRTSDVVTMYAMMKVGEFVVRGSTVVGNANADNLDVAAQDIKYQLLREIKILIDQSMHTELTEIINQIK